MSLLTKHLSEEIFSNLAEGKLQKEALADAENHLSACKNCSSEAETFAKIIGLMKADDSQDAPKDSIKWAKNMFRARIAEPKKTILQKILAILEVDLSQNQPVFGERSGSSPVSQLLYKADEIGISLRITKEGEEAFVMGQILGDDFSKCEIELQNVKKTFIVSSNELSEFKVSKIPRGNYDMFIRNAEKEILIQNISFT